MSRTPYRDSLKLQKQKKRELELSRYGPPHCRICGSIMTPTTSGESNRFYCSLCKKRAGNARYEQDKERIYRVRKDWTLRRYFGITLEEYKVLFKSQNGVCKICKCPTKRKYLSVDHDHETGEVRGLLCHHCNSGLGMFRDNPWMMRRAALYLERKL